MKPTKKKTSFAMVNTTENYSSMCESPKDSGLVESTMI